jgi:hypothetical protein
MFCIDVRSKYLNIISNTSSPRLAGFLRFWLAPSSGWPDDLEKNRPIFWKLAKTAVKPNSARIQKHFWTAYLGEKCNKFEAQGTAIFGHFINEPPKSSLIGEKSPNLVTLSLMFCPVKSF